MSATLHTEEEAKKKYCHRAKEFNGFSTTIGTCCCMGSKCMAWKWHGEMAGHSLDHHQEKYGTERAVKEWEIFHKSNILRGPDHGISIQQQESHHAFAGGGPPRTPRTHAGSGAALRARHAAPAAVPGRHRAGDVRHGLLLGRGAQILAGRRCLLHRRGLRLRRHRSCVPRPE